MGKCARGLYTPAPVLLLRTYLVSNIVADHLVLLDQVPDESHALFLERFDELLALLPVDPIESQYLGQDILCQVIARYPQIAHLVPRDLLWYFAGDCLHYMPDDEIDLYQALEERRFEAEQNDEPFDWNQEKQLLSLSNQDSKH
jgi:hypothetical protein